MSGGFLKRQKAGDHQVVMFTFVGELTKEHVDTWNEAILDLKRKFGRAVTSVTMTGHSTPAKLRGRSRRE